MLRKLREEIVFLYENTRDIINDNRRADQLEKERKRREREENKPKR